MAVAKLCIGLGTALFALAPSHSRALDYAGPQFTYYAVSGSAADIARQMHEKGRDGHFAYTDYHIDYRFVTRPTASTCAVASATVLLRVTVLMPQLAGADARVRGRWSAFEPALRRHEMGHADNALAAAHDIESALLDIRDQPSCPVADALVKKVADEIFAALKNLDQSYDRKTDHGKTQGAVFP